MTKPIACSKTTDLREITQAQVPKCCKYLDSFRSLNLRSFNQFKMKHILMNIL